MAEQHLTISNLIISDHMHAPQTIDFYTFSFLWCHHQEKYAINTAARSGHCWKSHPHVDGWDINYIQYLCVHVEKLWFSGIALVF